jgi:anti-sigma B factor antagonist
LTLEKNHSEPDFSVLRLSHFGSETVIALAGELDLASAPALQDCLSEATAGGAETIGIDLGRLTYIDSAGLGVLVSAHKRLESMGGSLVIRQPNDRVMRIFTVSGLSNYLNIKR